MGAYALPYTSRRNSIGKTTDDNLQARSVARGSSLGRGAVDRVSHSAQGTRRIYAIDAAPLQQVDAWLDHFRGFWTHKLLALHTEIARGKKRR